MSVYCSTCGLLSARHDVCEHCRQPLSSDVGVVRPEVLPPRPAPQGEEELPVVRPATPTSSRRANTAQPSSERIVARKTQTPAAGGFPWVVVVAAGVVVCLGLVVWFVIASLVRQPEPDKLAGKTATTTATKAAPRDQMRELLAKAKAPPLSRATMEKLLKLAEPKARENLVDLGCGAGDLAFFAADEMGLIVVAFEKEAALVKLAQDRVDAKVRNTVIGVKQVANIFEADLKHADIIVMTHPDRWDSLDQVRRMLEEKILDLKEGVRILSTQPILARQHTKAEGFAPPDDPGKHYTLYLYKLGGMP